MDSDIHKRILGLSGAPVGLAARIFGDHRHMRV